MGYRAVETGSNPCGYVYFSFILLKNTLSFIVHLTHYTEIYIITYDKNKKDIFVLQTY